MYRHRRTSRSGPERAGERRFRAAELAPSAATTRSWLAASSPAGGASVAEAARVTPSSRHRSLQDLQQPAAVHRGEAVPAAGDDLALDVHVDVVPAGELALHRAVDRRIGVLDAAQGLVREHHAEAERVVGRVPLPDGDLVPGPSCLARAAKYSPPGPPPVTAIRTPPPRPLRAATGPAPVPVATGSPRHPSRRHLAPLRQYAVQRRSSIQRLTGCPPASRRTPSPRRAANVRKGWL